MILHKIISTLFLSFFLLILILCIPSTIKAMDEWHLITKNIREMEENKKKMNELSQKIEQLKIDHALGQAARMLDVEKAQSALKNGADSNASNFDRKPLSIAIRSYCYAASMTKNKWMTLDDESKAFWAPAIVNFHTNGTKMIQLLLDHGADITIKDEDGNTTLQLATVVNCPGIVKLFTAHHNNDFDEKRQTAFEEALQLAVKEKYPEIYHLIDHKMRREAINIRLFDAVVNLDIEKAQLSLNDGANSNCIFNMRNKNNCTPLSFAIKIYSKAASLTKNKSMALDDKSKAFWDPAIKNFYAHDTKVIQLLLDHGADITIEDTNGDSALKIATELNLPHIVELLIFHSDDTKRCQIALQDALKLAQKNKFQKIIDLLENAQKNQIFMKKHELMHQRISHHLPISSLQQNFEPLLHLHREKYIVTPMPKIYTNGGMIHMTFSNKNENNCSIS
jgi:ankyrin repeat protein